MPAAFRVAVSVDLVLLTVHGGRLCVALLKREGKDSPSNPFAGEWALPGGSIDSEQDVTLADTLRRVVESKAGVTPEYFEQLQSFGDSTRDPRGWTVSVAYLALVRAEEIPTDSPLKLVAVDEIDALPFDHLKILSAGVERVRSKSAYSSLPLVFAPETFTMLELRTVYAQVRGEETERGVFQRAIEALDVVEKVEGVKASNGGRNAYVYRRKPSLAGLGVLGTRLTKRVTEGAGTSP